MAAVLEGKSIGLDTKTVQKESSWFGEPKVRLGTRVQSNSRIQFASNQSKLVPRKLDPGPLSKVDPQHWSQFHAANWTFKPTFSCTFLSYEACPFFYWTKIKREIVWALQMTCSTPKHLLSSTKVSKSQKASKQSTKLPCHFSGASLFVFL
jgi:hypothetical protein